MIVKTNTTIIGCLFNNKFTSQQCNNWPNWLQLKEHKKKNNIFLRKFRNSIIMLIIVIIIIMSIIMRLISQPLLLPACGLLPLPVDEAIQAKLIILRSAANRSTSQPVSQPAGKPESQASTQPAINPAFYPASHQPNHPAQEQQPLCTNKERSPHCTKPNIGNPPPCKLCVVLAFQPVVWLHRNEKVHRFDSLTSQDTAWPNE